MIRRCRPDDFEAIWSIINDGAGAYRGIIPADRWQMPYMDRPELQTQLDEGVEFWGYEDAGELVAVMGIQPVQDVTLIRHAYVRTTRRRGGLGAHLLTHLTGLVATPVLIGTWAAADWAIHFYEKNGFRRVPSHEKDQLLRRYWNIPESQIETSVVLADTNWLGQFRDKPNL